MKATLHCKAEFRSLALLFEAVLFEAVLFEAVPVEPEVPSVCLIGISSPFLASSIYL